MVQQRQRRVTLVVVRRCQRQVQRALEVQPVGGGGGRRAGQQRGRGGTTPLLLLVLHLQLRGHQLLLELLLMVMVVVVLLLELLVLVLASLELLLGTGGQQGLQGAALLVLLAGLTVLDQVVAGRWMVEAVPMPMAVPMAIDCGGCCRGCCCCCCSIALQCRGGGIGLVVCGCCCCRDCGVGSR